MENFEERLKEYEQKCEQLEHKEFEDFGHLERTYCDLINEGGMLRQYLIQNPELCDKKSLLVLTNKVTDLTHLNSKYKSLVKIIEMTVKLLEKYSVYVKELLNDKKFEEAINIYSQMYTFTKNPIYKKNIIEIYYKNLNDIDIAMEICESIKPILLKDQGICYLYAEMFKDKGDNENSEFYFKKAKELSILAQIKPVLDEKNYDKAIELYNKLFNLTNNYSYKKEIANIYAVCLSNVNKALNIYKDLEPNLKNEPTYWWQISELYGYNENKFKEVQCIQKALKLELLELENKKEKESAI